MVKEPSGAVTVFPSKNGFPPGVDDDTNNCTVVPGSPVSPPKTLPVTVFAVAPEPPPPHPANSTMKARSRKNISPPLSFIQFAIFMALFTKSRCSSANVLFRMESVYPD